MSIGDFKLGITSNDQFIKNNGFIKRDFAKIYDQKGVESNRESQNVESNFVEHDNY